MYRIYQSPLPLHLPLWSNPSFPFIWIITVASHKISTFNYCSFLIAWNTILFKFKWKHIISLLNRVQSPSPYNDPFVWIFSKPLLFRLHLWVTLLSYWSHAKLSLMFLDRTRYNFTSGTLNSVSWTSYLSSQRAAHLLFYLFIVLLKFFNFRFPITLPGNPDPN